MPNTITIVGEQIRNMGGELSAGLLGELFGQYQDGFNQDLDPRDVLRVIWERYNHGEVRRGWNEITSPLWRDTGASGGFNMIPSTIEGQCNPTCLTLISDGFSGRGYHPIFGRRPFKLDFNKAMLLLCDYWFSCLKVNRENILLTTSWDQEFFQQHYQPVIETYVRQHGKKVFIIEIGKSGLFLRYPY